MKTTDLSQDTDTLYHMQLYHVHVTMVSPMPCDNLKQTTRAIAINKVSKIYYIFCLFYFNFLLNFF